MSKQKDGNAFEVMQEVYTLARDIDKTMNRLELALSNLESRTDINTEEIRQLKKELDKALAKWQKVWNTNKNYVYFSIGLGIVGASATLGFDFIVELARKFLGIK
jgi:lipopolysaccharide biosynthesis regulator YciM